MNLTNSQIRTRARHLLDDNIFGKDWLKSAFLSTVMLLFVISTGGSLFALFNFYITPFLMRLVALNPELNASAFPIVLRVVLEIVELLILAIPVGPILVGISSTHIDLVRDGGNIKITRFFAGFRGIVDNFQLGFFYVLNVVVWSCLFILPGIYVAYGYAMAFYVRKDNPTYTWRECFDESERIMEGNRWRLFKLHCNFFGWLLLGAAFAGVGLLWVFPYASVSTAVFYEEASNNAH